MHNTHDSRAHELTPGFCCGSVFSSFWFVMLSYYVSLRSAFRVVMSATISTYKLCSVCFYLQLSVGGLMAYLRFMFCVSIVVCNTQ